MLATFKRIQPSHVLGTLLLSCAAAAWADCCGSDAGRMTGGGSIICQGSAYRWTFGYELHCKRPGTPVSEPNNLEVNLSTGDHFHLTTLATSPCSGPDATTPDAPINTMHGSGPGTLNGEPAYIWFNFVDKAEPGAGVDYAAFTIRTAAGTLLHCENTLEGGNNQAHRATGNKP